MIMFIENKKTGQMQTVKVPKKYNTPTGKTAIKFVVEKINQEERKVDSETFTQEVENKINELTVQA